MGIRHRIDRIRNDFAAVEPHYESVARLVRQHAEEEIKARKVKAEFDHRIKDLDSLVKKMFRKPYSSLGDVTDLAGVRVIVPSQDEIKNVCSIIESAFQVVRRENKTEDLGIAEMGYRGTQFQVKAPSDDIKLRELECEIQVRTRAEHLWSAYSHELFYKSAIPLPRNLQRSFNRLAALIEIFDEEVTRTMHYLDNIPKGEDFALIRLLKDLFEQAGGNDFDRELTHHSVQALQPILSSDASVDAELQYIRLQKFFDRKKEKITELFNREKETFGNPILVQPESILVWFLLDEHLHAVTTEWDRHLDSSLLDDLAQTWGARLPESA